MILEHLEHLQSTLDEARPWPGHWSVSSFGGCPRALLAQAQGLERQSSISPDIARLGHLLERAFRKELRLAGFRLEHVQDEENARRKPLYQVRYGGEDWPVMTSGGDGFLHVPGGLTFLLEYTTAGPIAWRRLALSYHEANPVKYAQIQGLFYSLPDCPGQCLLVVENRSTGKRWETIIRPEQEYLGRLLYDSVAPAFSAVGASSNIEWSPVDKFRCHSSDWVRQHCPYRHLCDEGKPAMEITSEELSDQAANWRAAKEVAKAADDAIQEARQTFSAALRGAGLSRAETDGVRYSLTGGKRATPDLVALRGILGDDLDQYLTEIAWETVRVTEGRAE